MHSCTQNLSLHIYHLNLDIPTYLCHLNLDILTFCHLKYGASWAVISDQNITILCENSHSQSGPVSPEGTQERNKEDWPSAEMCIKGVILVSPDLYIFPWELAFCKYFSVNLVFCKSFVPITFPFLQKLKYLSSPFTSSEQFSQGYLRCCLWGSSPTFTPNKT